MDDATCEGNALCAVLSLETGELGADVVEGVLVAAVGFSEAVHPGC